MAKRTIDVLGLEGAADAGRIPIGMEHEVMDDELASTRKEIAEGFAAGRRIEEIGLVDPNPRQSAPLGG
jgi:hypothetical protein